MTATDLDLDALLDALTARAIQRAQAVELVNVAGQPVGPDLRASTGRLQVNPGDIIASVWGNTTYDQTVQAYDTTAARDSQWPTPKDGAVAYTADTLAAWLRRAGAWKGLPLGQIASIVGPATAVSCGATLTTVLSMSAPVTAGRWYRVSVTVGNVAQQTTAATAVRYSITPTPGLSNNYFVMSNSLAVGAILTGSASYLWQATTTTTQAFTFAVSTNAGTLNVNINAVLLAVEDAGT